MQSDPIDHAIRHYPRRTFRHGERTIVVACLIHTADWRPLQAPWWHGKEVCIIGADLDGNFFLRHCGGAVLYWDHRSQSATTIAASVQEFVAALID